MRILKYDLEKNQVVSGLKEDIDSILDKAVVRRYHGSSILCWNIKVYGCDWSGHSSGLELNRKWDFLWEKYLEQPEMNDFFWWCCENGLDFVGDRKTRLRDLHEGVEGLKWSDYEIWQYGRSGGWLGLYRFDGYDPLESVEQAERLMEELDELEKEYRDAEEFEKEDILDSMFDVLWQVEAEKEYIHRLAMFCKLLCGFDALKEWNFQCGCAREDMEGLWEKGDFSCFSDDTLEDILKEPESENIRADIERYLKKEVAA